MGKNEANATWRARQAEQETCAFLPPRSIPPPFFAGEVVQPRYTTRQPALTCDVVSSQVSVASAMLDISTYVFIV